MRSPPYPFLTEHDEEKLRMKNDSNQDIPAEIIFSRNRLRLQFINYNDQCEHSKLLNKIANIADQNTRWCSRKAFAHIDSRKRLFERKFI